MDSKLIPRVFPALLLACSLLPAATASAVEPQFTLGVDVTPNVAGTPATPAPTTLTLHTTTVPKLGDPPFSSSRLDFDLDPAIVLGPSGAVGCACDPIGDGSMRITVLGLTEDLTITTFRAGTRDVLLQIRGKSPLQIDSVLRLVGTPTAAGGTTLRADVPATLQQPAPGAYATYTDLVFSLRSTVALVGCPVTMALAFASRSDFTDGSSAQATAVAPCAPSPLPVVQPAAPVQPVFATKVARHRGRVLGTLLGLASVRGMTAGKVSLRCDVGCSRHQLGSRDLSGSERSALIRLRPPVRVTSRTRISVVTIDSSNRRQTQRFRFVRSSGGLTAKRV
jgi:hypothetical protein